MFKSKTVESIVEKAVGEIGQIVEKFKQEEVFAEKAARALHQTLAEVETDRATACQERQKAQRAMEAIKRFSTPKSNGKS